MAERQALGRGLSALISRTDRSGSEVRTIPMEHLHRNALQPRKRFDEAGIAELAASIREKGLLQPIVVRRAPEGFEIVIGERRCRAARMAGLASIPAIVRETSDRESLELALVENIQREDLDPIELANAYQGLMELNGLTQEEVAGRLGLDRATVANTVRLLGLPPEIQRDVAEGRLSMGHARALLGCSPHARQRALRDRIVREGLSVREVERLVREAREAGERPGPGLPRPPARSEAEEALRHHFQTPVAIKRSRRGGRVEIRFYNDEDLDRILDLILRE
jgi:ParB family chromosome partitioning protein